MEEALFVKTAIMILLSNTFSSFWWIFQNNHD